MIHLWFSVADHRIIFIQFKQKGTYWRLLRSSENFQESQRMRLAGHITGNNAARGRSMYPNHCIEPAKPHDCGHLMLVLMVLRTGHVELCHAPRGIRRPSYYACPKISSLSVPGLHCCLWASLGCIFLADLRFHADTQLLEDWNHSF